MAPRLMPWAVVTIRLCAAWRNTSVNRTTGTAPEAMMSASTWPGPTEGSWSTSPTISSAASSGTAASSARISMTSNHRGLVDHQQAAVERVVRVAPEPAITGVDLQQAVNRLRLEPGGLAHPLGRAPGRRTQQDIDALGGQDAQESS